MDYQYIAFTDIETSGLDPEKDELLEIAIVLTDLDLVTIAQRAWLVEPRSLNILGLDPYVRKMHNENGLFSELSEAQEARMAAARDYVYLDSAPSPHLTDASGVDVQINSWLRAQLRPPRGILTDTLALGGSGVSHFESRWLPIHLPKYAAVLHRSTVDVGVMRRFIENVVRRPRLVPTAARQLEHRAMDDVHKHLREARRYRDLLKKV